MPNPGYGENGSIIGPQNTPTSSSAPGVWSLGEIAESLRDSAWPVPFNGWIGQFTSGVSGATYASSPMVSLNSNDDLWVGYRQVSSGTNPVVLAKITSAGALSSTHSLGMSGSAGAVDNAMGRMTVPSDGTDIYISGYANGGGSGVGSWRIKYNDSLTEQWFGWNSSDNLAYRQSTDATYENTSMGMYVSRDGTRGIHAPYGYVSGWGSYNYFCDPFDPADGEEWAGGYSALMQYSSSVAIGSYFRSCQINGSNMAGIDRQYNATTGGYNSLIFKSDNQISGGTSYPTFVAYALRTVGSGYPGIVKMPPYGYNTVGNVDRYPFVLNSETGTYSGDVVYARWNHASSAASFDQETLFEVNAADSPATPTQIQPDGLAIKSDDSTVYMLVRDNGNTPNQMYLVSFDPDTTSSTVNWQNKILVYRTADGSSVQNVCYVSNIEIDSTDEFLYFAGSLTTSGTNRNEIIVFKLPTDGTGTGTWTVGDYTVVYGASTMTVSNTSVLSVSTSPGTIYTSAPNETNTLTASTSSLTGTLTQGTK